MPPSSRIINETSPVITLKGWADANGNGKHDDGDPIVVGMTDKDGNTTERWISRSEFINDKKYEKDFGSAKDRAKLVDNAPHYKGAGSLFRPFQSFAKPILNAACRPAGENK